MKLRIIKENLKPKLIRSRLDVIYKIIKDKDVLDIGCVNHEAERAKDKFWLHRFIKNHAKSLLGLDYDKVEVEKLKKDGYRIEYGDAQNFDLGKKFDIIVAGELIEHLPNPGKLIECCKKHLKDSGILIITTPNAFSFRNLLRGILLGVIPTNEEHTCWFTPITFRKLCETQGIDIFEYYLYFNPESSKIKYLIERLICFFRPSYGPNMLFILKPKT